jgi:hypothetical protein
MPASLDEVEAYALTVAVSTSWAFIRTQHGSRPKHIDTLRTVLERHSIPKKFFVLHPASLAHALGDMLPEKDAILKLLDARLRVPSIDPLNIFADPGSIPASTLERVHRDLARLVSKQTFTKPEGILQWLLSQSYCHMRIDVDAVIGGLEDLGALIIDMNNVVWYVDAMVDFKGDVALFLPYLQPWLLECLPSIHDIPIAHIRPAGQSMQRLSRDFRTKKERTTQRDNPKGKGKSQGKSVGKGKSKGKGKGKSAWQMMHQVMIK